jgi:hypothetical protein
MHDVKVRELYEKYLANGYNVILEPGLQELPFDLGGYRPDLIAEKEGDHLVVEVKTSRARLPVEQLRLVSEEISKHLGWRFVLITLDDDGGESPFEQDDYPDWELISARLNPVERLIEVEQLEPAILYLWSIFEVAMRKRAREQSIPVYRLPASNVVNHLFSQGEISITDYDCIRDLQSARNKIAHGEFATAIDRATARRFYEIVRGVIDGWRLGPSHE